MLELISKLSKVSGYNTNMQKSVAFFYANNEQFEKEINKASLFMKMCIIIKHLEIYLTMEVKDMYTDNYKDS